MVNICSFQWPQVASLLPHSLRDDVILMVHMRLKWEINFSVRIILLTLKFLFKARVIVKYIELVIVKNYNTMAS